MYTLRYNEDFYVSDLSYGEEVTTTDDEDYLLDNLTSNVYLPEPMETSYCESIENLLVDGRISLAYEKLSKIPRAIADKFASATQILDLSFNSIKDLSFLVNFKCLNTLILDRNEQPHENTLPYLPSLKILCFYVSDLSYGEEVTTTDDEDYLLDNLTSNVYLPEPMETSYCESIENLLVDGRISLAYEKLSKIPRAIADKFASATQILDLSFNSIKDLSFLVNFKCLNTLILDRNEQPHENTLPYLPSLKILWLNNCNIYNMSKWITRLQTCCPNIKQLSLIGNPGILSAFNGGSVLEQYDYRMYIISVMPKLQYLDGSVITEYHRQQANSNKRAYALSGGPLRFIEKFGESTTDAESSTNQQTKEVAKRVAKH